MWWPVSTAALALLLILILGKLSDILRAILRLESRITLVRPLQEEEHFLLNSNDHSRTRSDIVKRAMHPDIWQKRWLDLQISPYYAKNNKEYWQSRNEERKSYRE